MNHNDEIARITGQNQHAWDEIARVRHTSISHPASFYATGGSILDPRTVQAAGDVKGRTLLQLQCSTGEETISWAVLGARAAGVDISPVQIELARALAREAGLDVRFEAADVYALPPDFQAGTMDIVTTGGGSLVWLPDLAAWAAGAARALRPGGRLILLEEHPLVSCLEIGPQGELRLNDDYFRRARPWEGSGWGHFSGGENAVENKYEFNWPLGDVVSALASTGLRIEHLEEYPSSARWRFSEHLQDVASLPGEYLLTAIK
jgi:SAM-dependent methyltransferase